MRIGRYINQITQYLECFGIYYVVFPICVIICISGILSPILNEYQGNCWLPYISEVSKEGVLYYLFLIGTSVSIIPWIVVMFGYMKINIQVFYIRVENWFIRLAFRLVEHFIFMLQVSACLCLFFVSLFSIYTYPDFHEDVTTWVSIAGNLSFILDYAICKYVNRDLYFYQGKTKFWCICISFIGMGLFGTLNFTPGCSVQFLPLDECFKMTSFDRCLYAIDQNNPSMTLYRYYPYCSWLHWIRGFVEYIAFLASFYYINLMSNDSLYLNVFFYEQTGLCENPFIFRYIHKYRNQYMFSVNPIKDDKEKKSNSDMNKISKDKIKNE